MNPKKVDFPGFEHERHPDDEKISYILDKYPDFDVIGAYNEGGNLDEIHDYLKSTREVEPLERSPQKVDEKLQKKYPNFDFQSALNDGGSMDEIMDYLKEYGEPEEKSFGEKAGRVAGQLALGTAQGSPLGMLWDAITGESTHALSQKEMLHDQLDWLIDKKSIEGWDEYDERQFESIKEQLNNPEAAKKNRPEFNDLTIRGLAEKATGLDLEPEGFLENAANWGGIIKDWKKTGELFKKGTVKDVVKSVLPSGMELSRGIGAATGLQMAEEGNFGPAGTIGMTILGDIAVMLQKE